MEPETLSASNNNELKGGSQQELSDLIRDNLSNRRQQMLMRTMVKQSLMKQSLMKDSLMKVDIQRGFDHIFQPNPTQINNPAQYGQSLGALIQTTAEIKSICEWLQDSSEMEAIAYLPDNQIPSLLTILSPKANLPIIMLTEYPHLQAQIIANQAKSIAWSILSANQSIDEKIKVLQKYELGRLNVLFVSASLWREEDWHQLESELLIVSNIRAAYTQKELAHIISKCKPNRVIYLHQSTLAYPNATRQQIRSSTSQQMRSSTSQQRSSPNTLQQLRWMPQCKHITEVTTSDNSYVVLKCNMDEKGRLLLNYLSKSALKKIVILVRSRCDIPPLLKLLSSAGKTPFNAYQPYQRESQSSTYSQNSKKIYDIVRRCIKEDVIVGDIRMDWLKYAKPDMAILYSFADAIQFVEFGGTAIKEKLLLYTQDEYYIIRNALTAQLPASSMFAPLISYILIGDNNLKSRVIEDDKLLARYSLGKENNERVLRVNWTARKFSCSKVTLMNTLSALSSMGIIRQQYKTIYQIQIEGQSYGTFKKKFPSYPQTKRKVSMLPLSTSMKTTTLNILKELKAAGIKFKVIQQAVMLVVVRNISLNESIPDYNSVYEMMTGQVWRDIAVLDRSVQVYRQIGYSSIELIRREKVLNRKDALLSFLLTNTSINGSICQSAHKVNQLITDVEQLCSDAKEQEGMHLDQHQICMILQGVEKGRSSKWKEHSLWSRYRKWKYEEILEVIRRMRGISAKKVKLE